MGDRNASTNTQKRRNHQNWRRHRNHHRLSQKRPGQNRHQSTKKHRNPEKRNLRTNPGRKPAGIKRHLKHAHEPKDTKIILKIYVKSIKQTKPPTIYKL